MPFTPIRDAVLPLLTDAQYRAEGFARSIVERFETELMAADWDANIVAPYPSNTRVSRSEWQRARERYALLRRLTEWVASSRHPSDPEIVVFNQERVERFISEARENAAAQYELFIRKLETKVGEHVAATLEGNHVWGYSLLHVTKGDGTTETWKTQQIVNVSKLSKVFNQWPTRKVKSR